MRPGLDARTSVGGGGTAEGALLATNNLSDLASASTARTNLGLGTMAVMNANAVAVTGGSITGLSALSVTNPAANSVPVTISGASVTGSDASSFLSIAGTWNTSGSPSAVKIVIGDQLSGSTAKAVEVLGGAGGATALFSVSKEGYVTTSALFKRGTAAGFTIYSGSTVGINLPADRFIGWSPTSNPEAAPDLVLLRDGAADTLCLRRGTNAQALNVYGTYTDASNYRRGKITTSTGGVLTIGAEGLGTGATGNSIQLATDGTTRLTIASTGAVTFSGSMTANGISASSVSASTSLYAASAGWIGFASRAWLQSPADGVIFLQNNAGTDFSRVQYGGTSNLFPSHKRSGTIIQGRLADDSDFCGIQGILQTHANAVAETPTATHTLLLKDASGASFKVLCVAA